MLKNLVKRRDDADAATSFEAVTADDPIAKLTDWSPAKGGGTNIKTHNLHQVHGQRLEFRCSIGLILFCGVFIAIGIGALIGASVLFMKGDQQVDLGALIGLPIFGLFFGAIGFFLLRSGLTPTVFDLGQGYYCKDRRKPEHMMDPSQLKNYARLEQIHAIQLISEHCSTKNSSYASYELNLVLKDGSRLNVIDHGNLTTIRRDAQTLATFLGKPLWDAI